MNIFLTSGLESKLSFLRPESLNVVIISFDENYTEKCMKNWVF